MLPLCNPASRMRALASSGDSAKHTKRLIHESASASSTSTPYTPAAPCSARCSRSCARVNFDFFATTSSCRPAAHPHLRDPLAAWLPARRGACRKARHTPRGDAPHRAFSNPGQHLLPRSAVPEVVSICAPRLGGRFSRPRPASRTGPSKLGDLAQDRTVRIACQDRTGIPTTKERGRETDRSRVCACLCRTLRPAETGQVEQRERWFGRSPRYNGRWPPQSLWRPSSSMAGSRPGGAHRRTLPSGESAGRRSCPRRNADHRTDFGGRCQSSGLGSSGASKPPCPGGSAATGASMVTSPASSKTKVTSTDCADRSDVSRPRRTTEAGPSGSR